MQEEKINIKHLIIFGVVILINVFWLIKFFDPNITTKKVNIEPYIEYSIEGSNKRATLNYELDEHGIIQEISKVHPDKGPIKETDIRVKINKASELENGDIITITLENINDIVFKDIRHKVKGLSDPIIYNYEDVQESIKYSFEGVDGKGIMKLDITKEKYKDLELYIPGNGELKNKDKVELKILNKDIMLSSDRPLLYIVEGLKVVPDNLEKFKYVKNSMYGEAQSYRKKLMSENLDFISSDTIGSFYKQYKSVDSVLYNDTNGIYGFLEEEHHLNSENKRYTLYYFIDIEFDDSGDFDINLLDHIYVYRFDENLNKNAVINLLTEEEGFEFDEVFFKELKG